MQYDTEILKVISINTLIFPHYTVNKYIKSKSKLDANVTSNLIGIGLHLISLIASSCMSSNNILLLFLINLNKINSSFRKQSYH